MFSLAVRAASELVMTIAPPRPPATMCGAAARRVFQVPERLMSIIVDQVCSSISSIRPALKIPALARMMSSRPSSATPASTASVRAVRSRMSTS